MIACGHFQNDRSNEAHEMNASVIIILLISFVQCNKLNSSQMV